MNNWPSIRDLIDHPAQMIIKFRSSIFLNFRDKRKRATGFINPALVSVLEPESLGDLTKKPKSLSPSVTNPALGWRSPECCRRTILLPERLATGSGNTVACTFGVRPILETALSRTLRPAYIHLMALV